MTDSDNLPRHYFFRTIVEEALTLSPIGPEGPNLVLHAPHIPDHWGNWFLFDVLLKIFVAAARPWSVTLGPRSTLPADDGRPVATAQNR